VKEFEKSLKDGLGEKSFEGLDINRPLRAYVLFKDNSEDCEVVLVIPTTTEKDFVAFLERIKIKAVAVKDKKGVYDSNSPTVRHSPGDRISSSLRAGGPTSRSTTATRRTPRTLLGLPTCSTTPKC